MVGEVCQNHFLHDRELLVGDTAFRGTFNTLNVFVECTASYFEVGGCPIIFARLKFFITEVNFDFVCLSVDGDLVTVLNQCNRATDLSFGSDMAHDESV